MIDQSHPYYQLACQMYPKVVNNLLAQQRITQMEANFIMSKVNGPEFSQFVQNAIASLPSIQGEQHMEKLIYDNLIGPMVQYIRQQAALGCQHTIGDVGSKFAIGFCELSGNFI